MPAATPKTIRNSFNTGEISPLLTGRIDEQRYYNALLTCENFWPLIQGGIQVRPGTIYAGLARAVTNHLKIRLLEFKFSAADQIIIEAGHNYFRFWQFDSTTGLPVQIGAPYTLTTTYADTDLDYIQVVQSGDVIYLTGGNPAQAPKTLTRITNTNWTIKATGFRPPPTSEETLKPVDTLTIATGTHWTDTTFVFLDGDIGRTIKTNDGGEGVITAIDGGGLGVTVQVITAPGAGPFVTGDWWLTGSPNGAYLQATTGYPVGAIITLTACAENGTAHWPATVDSFRATDVGKYINILGGVCLITSVPHAYQITAQVVCLLTGWIGPLDGAPGENPRAYGPVNCASPGAWTLETPVWSATLGYPSCVSMHQQRLLYANWPGYADSIRGSQIGDYPNFGTGLTDDAALDFTLATGTVVPIQWMCPDLNLILGTLTREFYAGDMDGSPLTPTSPKLTPHGSTGACGITAFVLESALLFITRGQRQVGELLFNVVTNRAEVVDLTEFASHLTTDVLTAADRILTANACQVQPVPIGWYIRADGTLCGLLYRRKQNVAGWFRTVTGRAQTQDLIESVAVIQNPVSQQDQAWLAVNRNGTRYIEIFDTFPNPYRKLDCSYKYTGAATATLTGLPQPDGWTVSIRGKGADGKWRLYVNQAVASSKVVGLSPMVVEAEVGLPFTATAVTPNAEFPGSQTIQGRPKAYGLMTVRTYATPSLKIQGVRYPTDPAYSGAAVYVIPTTGIPPQGPLSAAGIWDDFELSNIGVDRAAQVTLVQDLPLGGTVLMFCADLDVGA